MTNPLQRLSSYHAVPTTALLANDQVPTATHAHATAGMDALAQGSHYALQQLQQQAGVHEPHAGPYSGPHDSTDSVARPGYSHQARHRQSPYGPSGRGSSVSGHVRRRISRACDQCNQLRTKCDGQHPCAHCIGRLLFSFTFSFSFSSSFSFSPSPLLFLFFLICFVFTGQRLTIRIWPRMRVYSSAQKARQGFKKGTSTAGSGTGGGRRSSRAGQSRRQRRG